MIDLGGELRKAREEKGISLAEAGVATRIKERYLKALELNDWAALPTPVQARGFLRNYAVYLGLDEDQAMSWFSQATRSSGVSMPSSATADSRVRTTNQDGAVFRPRDIDISGTARPPAWLSSDVLIGVALALVVAIVGFSLLRLASGNSDDGAGAPTTSPAMTRSAPQATAGSGSAPGEATPAAVTPTFDASVGAVELSLVATEHVWVRVEVDGVQVLEGILAPDVAQSWRGTRQIVLETSNGAGLDAVVNGQPQERLGERGESITLVWGPGGPLLLTPGAGPE